MVDVNALLELVKEKTGITEEKAKSLLGGFFSFAKSHGIPVPEQAEKFVGAAEEENAATKSAGGYPEGGLLESAMGMVEQLGLDDDNSKSRAGEVTEAAAAAPATSETPAAAAPAAATATSTTPAGASSTPTSTAGEVESLNELMAFLKKNGIDPQQVMSVLPTIINFLKQQGIDVSALLKKIPGASTTSAGDGTKGQEQTAEQVAEEVVEVAGGLFNKASGLMGSFGMK